MGTLVEVSDVEMFTEDVPCVEDRPDVPCVEDRPECGHHRKLSRGEDLFKFRIGLNLPKRESLSASWTFF